MNSKSEIHISLRTTPFYKSWDIKTIGEKAGYKLRKKLTSMKIHSFVMKTRELPGMINFVPLRAPKGNRRHTCSGILAYTTGPEINKAFVFVSFSTSMCKCKI